MGETDSELGFIRGHEEDGFRMFCSHLSLLKETLSKEVEYLYSSIVVVKTITSLVNTV